MTQPKNISPVSFFRNNDRFYPDGSQPPTKDFRPQATADETNKTEARDEPPKVSSAIQHASDSRPDLTKKPDPTGLPFQQEDTGNPASAAKVKID